ncbi:MAG TPA: phosphotransferase [Caulobacteraceae bacterium]|jgi:hypothetical protein|nr:phosphotransferase [Caulobacteraceae bacterium]
MQKHETFDLMVHATPELEAALGETVIDRRHVRSWPLSAVEQLTTASGVRWIYKAQRTPTFEPDFYESVSSPLLPASRLLTRDAVYSTMLFEFVDAPLIGDMTLTEDDLARHGRALVDAIGIIDAAVPVYVDISTQTLWRAFAQSTLGMLSELVANQRLTINAAPGYADDVEKWAGSADIDRLIGRTSRLTHGDLNPGNVFVAGDGYRIIDWQRPQLAPADVDFIALLEKGPLQGTSQLFRHAPPAAVGVFYFLRLYWAVEAKTNLLPKAPGVFDRWATEAIGFIRQASKAAA